MRIASIKAISADRPLTELPVTLIQRTSQWSMVADAVFLAVSGLAFAIPAGLFAAEAMAAPSAAQNTITSQPIPTILTIAGLALLLVPIVFLMKRLATGIGGTRQVVLTESDITVTDRSLGRPRTWAAKLSEFKGITHHVRTSISHSRHELILVHSDPKRSVLLAISEMPPFRELSELPERVALRVIPASHLYRLPGFPKPA